MTKFHYDETYASQGLVLVVGSGTFDTHYCDAFVAQVDTLLERDPKPKVIGVQLTKVSFINSPAVGAIIKAYKHSKDKGVEVCLVSPSPFVKNVTSNLGINRLISVHDSLDAVVASLTA